MGKHIRISESQLAFLLKNKGAEGEEGALPGLGAEPTNDGENVTEFEIGGVPEDNGETILALNESIQGYKNEFNRFMKGPKK